MRYDHFLRKRIGRLESVWLYGGGDLRDRTLPILVTVLGESVWSRDGSFSRSQSDRFGVELVCSGSFEFRQGSRRYLVQPGEAFILREGVPHQYRSAGDGESFKRYISLSGPGLPNLARIADLWDRDHVAPARPDRVCRIMRDAMHIPRDDQGEASRRLSAVAYDLLVELSQKREQQLPAVVELGLTYIHRNLHHRIDREELSRQTGVSTPHFNRLFRQHVGTSPIRYFTEQRMTWTGYLLRSTTLSVKEIALKAGFEDPLYFSAKFKAWSGLCPTQYRVQAQREARSDPSGADRDPSHGLRVPPPPTANPSGAEPMDEVITPFPCS